MPVWSFSTNPAGKGTFTIEFWNPDMNVWSLPSEFNPGTGWMIDQFPRIRVTWKPVSPYTFLNWSIIGTASTESMANPYVGTVTDPNGGAFTAWVTTPTQYALTISVNDSAMGTTTPVPGTYQYPGGTTVSIRATPKTGYKFIRWDGDGAGLTTNPLPVTLYGNFNVIAVFGPEELPIYTVTLYTKPTSAYIYLQGVLYANNSSVQFGAPWTVSLQASDLPPQSYTFQNWTSTGAVSIANPTAQTTNATLSGNCTITANYAAIITYTPTISVSPTTIKAGDKYTVTGSGFNPALPIDFFITDLYLNNLQFASSKSPTPTGTVSIEITLNAAITYSGTGYVYATQTGGIESNKVQVSISSVVLPVHRFFTRYVRIDSGALPVYVTFYLKDLTDNTYISQDQLTVAVLGKKICFKGSGDRYDSHVIQMRLKNSGPTSITCTFGIAYNSGAAVGYSPGTLTPGSETPTYSVGTWANYSAIDFDWAGCEGAGGGVLSAECDAKFPNRGTNLWEGIGWGFCVAGNAVYMIFYPVFKPIFDKISAMVDPFLQPFNDAVTTITGIGTAVSLWIRDPWSEAKKVIDATWAVAWSTFETWAHGATALWAIIWKPVSDVIDKITVEIGKIGTAIWNAIPKPITDLFTLWLAWATNPVGEAFKLAAPIGAGLYAATTQVLKLADPFTEMFNPERFRTEEAKVLVRPIYEILHMENFQLHDLYSAIAEATYSLPFDVTEALIVGTHPATYADAKDRANKILWLAIDFNLIIMALRTLGKLAPILISALEGLADGLTQIAAILLAIKSATEIFSPGWRASTQIPLEREWLSRALPSRPSPAEYMSMRAEGTITKSDYTERMKGAGYPPEWSELLYDEYLREPSMRELATLYRRGKISRTAFRNLYELARLDPKYARLDPETGKAGSGSLDAWLEQIYNDPTWRQLNLMATSGKLTDEQIDDLLKAAGTRPEYLGTLKAVLQELPGQTQRRQVLTLEARLVALERLDEATYNADAVELKVAPAVAEMILRAERTRLKTGADTLERQESIGNLNTWYRDDIIDAATYRQDAAALGYSDTFINRQIADIDKKKLPVEPPPEKITEATRSMWDTFYTESIIDATMWHQAYTDMKYPATVIDLQLALLDKKKAPPVDGDGDLTETRDLLQGEALAAFKKRLIDEAKLRERLALLGRSPDAIDVLVAMAKVEQTVDEREVSLAIYADAYKYGAMERAIYLGKLIDAGYTNENAELIVATKELSWATGVETLTDEQILNSWEQGFLTIEQTTERLRKHGWTDEDMKIRLSFSVLDMLKAKHLTASEADKLWTDFGLGPEERAKLASWYGGAPA